MKMLHVSKQFWVNQDHIVSVQEDRNPGNPHYTVHTTDGQSYRSEIGNKELGSFLGKTSGGSRK